MAVTTTVAFYRGSEQNFAADAASASSNQGAFIPGTSGQTTLNGALGIGMLIASQDAVEIVIPGGSVQGYCWTLQFGGVAL